MFSNNSNNRCFMFVYIVMREQASGSISQSWTELKLRHKTISCFRPKWKVYESSNNLLHHSTMNRRTDRVLGDPREEILLETNFDDDGSAVTRAYNSYNSQQPLQPQFKVRKVRNGFRSEQSLDRYSVHGRGEGISIFVFCFCTSCVVFLVFAFRCCILHAVWNVVCRYLLRWIKWIVRIVKIALFYRRLLPIMHDENSICHPNCHTHVSVGRGHFLRDDVSRGFT